MLTETAKESTLSQQLQQKILVSLIKYLNIDKKTYGCEFLIM